MTVCRSSEGSVFNLFQMIGAWLSVSVVGPIVVPFMGLFLVFCFTSPLSPLLPCIIVLLIICISQRQRIPMQSRGPTIYSRTSIAWTPMARLPWLIRTHFFQSLRSSSDSPRKQIFREIFLFYREIVCCVYSLESPHRGDSNEYTQHTIIV